jgi:hypothetical protein
MALVTASQEQTLRDAQVCYRESIWQCTGEIPTEKGYAELERRWHDANERRYEIMSEEEFRAREINA